MKKYLIYYLVFLSTLSFAQSSKEHAEVRVTLRDGSIFNGTVKIKTVVLETDYGKLTIPFKNVGYIDVGITPDITNKSKIIDLIVKLSSDIEQVRKSAYDELLKIKINSVPVIKNYLFSDKYEPATHSDYTAENVLEELEITHNLTENYSENDVVSIDYQYLMGGVYSFQDIDLKTLYGNLKLPKERIKKIEVLYVPGEEGSSKTFILNASKHISGNASGGWLKTGIMIKKGQKLNISATGEVVLQSLSGGKYTPDGVVGTQTGLGYDNTYAQYGNLVFKIGEQGTMTVAGSKYNKVADNTGLLYLSIYETVYNASNSGYYNVKVMVK